MDITREMFTQEPVVSILASEASTKTMTVRRLSMFLDLTTNAVWFSVNGKRYDWLSDAIEAYNEISV